MLSMFGNYFKIALRHIIRKKVFSFINVICLATGLMCSILIVTYIKQEFSYDDFHKQADQIYRIVKQEPGFFYMGNDYFAVTPAPLAPALKNEFPEVIHATRIKSNDDILVEYQDKQFYEDGFYWADENFFNVFSLPLLHGDPKSALTRPYSIVLSEGIVRKYFGNYNPLGKVIKYKNKHNFEITGVMKNIPENSHLKCNFLASFVTLSQIPGEEENLDSWGNSNYYTYVLLQEKFPSGELEKKLPYFTEKYQGDFIKSLRKYESTFKIPKYILQPIRRIHLQSNLNFEIEKNNDIKNIYILSAIALFILIIACINYVNLSTVSSLNRYKEVGIRKVIGANRGQIIKQYIGESILSSFIALLFAVLLLEAFLPVFNSFFPNKIDFSYSPINLVALAFLCIVIGILSGIYPAFFISSFQPVIILKGSKKSQSKGGTLRNVLIVFQFSISITLIIGTIIIFKQIGYVKNKDIGFNRNQIIVIPIRNSEIINHYESIKTEVLAIPTVYGASSSSYLPNNIRTLTDEVDWEGKEKETKFFIYNVSVDYDFIPLFEIELKEGRNFSKEFESESQAYILNETAVRNMGWNTALNKQFSLWSKKGYIIGVVKDFQFTSLYSMIKPLVITLRKNYSYFFLKISPRNISTTLEHIKKKWKDFLPDYPFEYFFLDDHFNSMYQAEILLGKAFNYFAILAILIACLGTWGLVSFSVEQRTKEISIRKILGSSSSSAAFLFMKDYIKWLISASIIAWPIAYFVMQRWLYGFAYRININFWIFILSSAITLICALITISFKFIKVVRINPAETLRYE